MTANSRSTLYKTSIAISAVAAALAIATLLTLNQLTTAQVDSWVENLLYAVTVIGQAVSIVAGYVAKNHVTPDVPLDQLEG